ncbi:gliding-motility protein MglA [candidate division KSB1 bacterium]|nr:gliding-motility protein MglA [candidate division KSB1 bacterium]
MHIDYFRKEIQFKIVYYGPGLGGKTTNLEYLHANLNPDIRGELVSLKTKDERTLYFDFLQLKLGKIKNKIPRFHLYTIPGQIHYSYSRQIILRGADAVVFVADSQPVRMDENLETLADLEKKLILHKYSLDNFPWVLQYNKRDLADSMSIETMQSKLNFLNVPYHQAVAVNGKGVFETLRTAIELLINKI